MPDPLTKEAEDFLEDMAAELEVPPSRYEQARDRYRSLGEWLHRPESTVREFDPQIYAQGSFRLGTAIKPPSDNEDYDVDSNGAALGGTLSEAAWRTRPTFYLVGDEDHAIPRAEQERMAARMNATVAHVNSSHVPMLSQPAAVADFILQATA
jgi:pimeloyl-ACP methyl ester carboxylesterase